MLNREIYQKDPADRKLANEGVANVNDERTGHALSVLRYELETFVCDGQYQKGMQHILDTYLQNIERAQQPAVWISGFFGSGKSHLVKMLRALWVDTALGQGATARNTATLPADVSALFKELDIQGKRHGGLFAASGTLGSAASGSVRLAILRIVFKAAGLPEQYSVARFVLWLKSEGIYEQVKISVEEKGYNWEEELDNFYVAEGLHEALVEAKPNLFSSTVTCAQILSQNYPHVNDVSNDEMVKTIKQAISRDGKLPLTLIVLDEIQQYIGTDNQRSMDVQEAVESCCKKLGGRLLFVGTGQTAVTGTSNLKKLEGRFTIRIELSDTDVEVVIRKVILAKKADAIKPVEEVMLKNIGEISKHLTGTTIAHNPLDKSFFAQDYPILPVRKRFWENTLRVLDQTGTESQLRNQLSMIHKAIQTNLDENIGHVIPADYLYFDSAEKLLQSRVLPRGVHEYTLRGINGTSDEQLLARACGLIFLINRLGDGNKEIGIKANTETLADLMVENLTAGSSNLRSKLQRLLQDCELLMQVGDEYRIQTEESTAWRNMFENQRSSLSNDIYRIESERDERLKQKFSEIARNIKPVQGVSRVSRTFQIVFDAQLPADHEKKSYLWVRHGWSIDENSVKADARQAGNASPTVFVYLPKSSASDLRDQIISFKAASNTLELKGVPSNAEGLEARSAMETTKQVAENKINELLNEVIYGARVFQAGGREVVAGDLKESLQEAVAAAMQRLYKNFSLADHAGWAKVYQRAKEGAPDALRAIGYNGDHTHHPVSQAVLQHIGAGKKGAELRSFFEAAPYGWSGDAIDGALYVLLAEGSLNAVDERGSSVEAKTLERKALGKTTFKIERILITAKQRIEIRRVMQKAGCKADQGEELAAVPVFVQAMQNLAEKAGGEPPRPEKPDVSILDDINQATGNEKLLIIFSRAEELKAGIDQWKALAEQIEKRIDTWDKLERLLEHGSNSKAALEAKMQADVIKSQRYLLQDPDPVLPLLKSLSASLRTEIDHYHHRYLEELKKNVAFLNNNPVWQKLDDHRKDDLLKSCAIEDPGAVDALDTSTDETLISTLKETPLPAWINRIDALSGRFARVQALAAKELEPDVQPVELPRLVIRTDAELDEWIEKAHRELKSALARGPIVIS